MDTKKQTNDFVSQAVYFFGMLATQTSTIWCVSTREFL